MSRLLAEVRWRGFVHEATPHLAAHVDAGPVTLYCGFDPTAPSLQVGNLVPIMLLAQFQRAGHRPIVLMGGGTGLIGDPSGKPGERPLLSPEQISENLRRQRDQMAPFLDFDPGPTQALVLDNAKWLVPQTLVTFLRDVGKHFTVNVMLQKESVKARLDAGISYTEFSYMLLQAYDFLHLFRTQRCTLQVGGSDQWGNITAGVELIRRIEGGEAHGLVAPLIATATGKKFGKTEAGSVWLDPALTSPFKFYQFWVSSDDRDVESHLKLFTHLRREEIEERIQHHQKAPAAREAQHKLAIELTKLVHGDDVTRRVVAAHAILFQDWDPRQEGAEAFDTLANELPTATMTSGDSIYLVDAVLAAGLANSKGEARRAIEQGGIYLNQQRATDPKRAIGTGDLLAGGYVLLRKGSKHYALARIMQT